MQFSCNICDCIFMKVEKQYLNTLFSGTARECQCDVIIRNMFLYGGTVTELRNKGSVVAIDRAGPRTGSRGQGQWKGHR